MVHIEPHQESFSLSTFLDIEILKAFQKKWLLHLDSLSIKKSGSEEYLVSNLLTIDTLPKIVIDYGSATTLWISMRSKEGTFSAFLTQMPGMCGIIFAHELSSTTVRHIDLIADLSYCLGYTVLMLSVKKDSTVHSFIHDAQKAYVEDKRLNQLMETENRRTGNSVIIYYQRLINLLQ